MTREHVPPKNLFLPPRPRNTITVPVCAACNHGYHLDDEYFRVFIAASAEPATVLWRLWKEKVVGSSFTRSGGLKGRMNDDHALLLRHHQRDPIRSPTGEILADEVLPRAYLFDASRVTAVMEKIVRCLHFLVRGVPLSRAAGVEVAVADPTEEELHGLYDSRTGHVGNADEFVFRCERRGVHQSRCLVAFYRHVIFDIHVRAS